MVKTAGYRNLGDAGAGVCQQIPADLQPVFVCKIDGRLPEVAFEDNAAFAAADVSGGGYGVERQCVLVMLVYV